MTLQDGEAFQPKLLMLIRTANEDLAHVSEADSVLLSSNNVSDVADLIAGLVELRHVRNFRPIDDVFLQND